MSRRAAWLAGGLSALSFPLFASAQTVTPPAAGQPGIEEVVVTAQKRSERLSKVPLPVQAISGKELERAGITTATDLVRAIPTASVVSSVSPGFDTIEIRGIGSGTTGDSLVGYYLDDTPFGIPNLQLAPPSRLLDVQRVEVIRGPSGTLYGQGSAGGTVKIVTNKPDLEKFGGSIASEFSTTQGSKPNYETDFMLNVPLLRDRLGVRVSGSYESLAGYAHVPEEGPRDDNGVDLKNIRTEIRWQPTSDVTVDGLYWHIENSQDFNNNLTPQNAPAQLKSLLTGVYASEGLGALAPVYAGLSTNIAYPAQPIGPKTIAGIDGTAGFTNTLADIYSLDVNWNTSLGTVTSNSSYIQHKLAFSDPVVGYLVNDSSFKTNSFTEELRIASDPTSRIKYLLGATYRDATIHSDIDFFADEKIFFLPGNRLPLIDIVGPLTTHSYAVFGEVSTSLFNGLLEPLVGLRYFNDDRYGVSYVRNLGVYDPGSANFNSVNPRFNLKLNAAPNGIVYFNAAKGFRSGTIQTQQQVQEAAAQGIPTNTVIQPDRLWTYELGTRWQLLDNTLSIEGSIYRTDWRNVQIVFVNTASSVSVVNGGDATIDGADAGLRWRTPVDGLSLSANGGYLDARFTRIDPALAASTAIRDGGALPNVPRATYALGADYTRTLPQLWDAVLSLDASYSFRSDQIDPASGLRSGNVNDFSLRASLAKGPWRAEIFALNALDSSTPELREQFLYQIPYPRRVGVRLSYSF